MADYDYRPYVEYGPYTQTGEDFTDFRDEMFVGEDVLALYGDPVGTVGEMHEFGFRVDRPYDSAVTLPYTAIQDVSDGQVLLSLPAERLGQSYLRNRRASDYHGYERNNYGPYHGLGPKGYTRSDDRIRDDVNEHLWLDDQLDATGIDVQVHDGVVTLDGVVDSRWAKRRAEDNAWAVAGAVDVINHLHRASGDWDNWRDHMHFDMDVVGSLGSKVGTIGEIRDYDFLLERKGLPGLWIPFSAIQDVHNDRLILGVTKDELDKQGWLFA